MGCLITLTEGSKPDERRRKQALSCQFYVGGISNGNWGSGVSKQREKEEKNHYIGQRQRGICGA